MPGTRAGAAKAAAKNLAKNPNFYRDIGKIGGMNGSTGGFAANVTCEDRKCPYLKEYRGKHFIRNCAGFLGGKISRRKKVVRNDLNS